MINFEGIQPVKVPLGTPELRVAHGVELRAFSLSRLAPKVLFWDLGNGLCQASMTADVWTTERDDPYRSTRIDFHESVLCNASDLCDRSAPMFVAWALRRFLLGVLLHELDERLLVSGVRVFDPHASKGG